MWSLQSAPLLRPVPLARLCLRITHAPSRRPVQATYPGVASRSCHAASDSPASVGNTKLSRTTTDVTVGPHVDNRFLVRVDSHALEKQAVAGERRHRWAFYLAVYFSPISRRVYA